MERMTRFESLMLARREGRISETNLRLAAQLGDPDCRVMFPPEGNYVYAYYLHHSTDFKLFKQFVLQFVPRIGINFVDTRIHEDVLNFVEGLESESDSADVEWIVYILRMVRRGSPQTTPGWWQASLLEVVIMGVSTWAQRMSYTEVHAHWWRHEFWHIFEILHHEFKVSDQEMKSWIINYTLTRRE